MGLAEYAEEESSREALNRALRKIDELKRSKAELVDAVYQAAHDAATAMVYDPVPAPPADRRRDSENAIVLLSDWQLGKITPTYSSDVCARRIEKLAQKVRLLTEIQREDHAVHEVHVLLLGDLIEGELIFPGQAHRIDSSLFAQVMVDGPRILGGFLRSMASSFRRVRVSSVIGNHGAIGGRSRREMHPESNADAMLYEMTRVSLAQEERITWGPIGVKGERDWYEIAEVGEQRFFMFHGDQVRGGFAGFPWYGFDKKLAKWYAKFGPFNYAVSGHYHTPVRAMYGAGEITHWGNGSTESDNTYAQEQLAASSYPSQWLLFVHPTDGVTAEYEVHL